MPAAKKTTGEKPGQQFVTQEKFDALSDSVGQLVGLVKQSLEKSNEAAEKVAASIPETQLEKDIKKAGPKHITPVNPEWEEKAREIIGADVVDHCEMEHLRSGGIMFTVVIKKEKSNASESYLQMHKEDRRTREVGAEGIAGVENWCKLIAQNLKRPVNYTSAN